MPGNVWQHREGMHEIEDKVTEWRPQDAGDDRCVEHLPRKAAGSGQSQIQRCRLQLTRP